jgi:hypothetical protein
VSRVAASALLIAALAACATAQDRSGPERRAELDSIAAKCGLPARMLRMVGKDALRFNPDPDTSYRAVDCALTELRKTDIPMKLGFVANSAPPEAEEP